MPESYSLTLLFQDCIIWTTGCSKTSCTTRLQARIGKQEQNKLYNRRDKSSSKQKPCICLVIHKNSREMPRLSHTKIKISTMNEKLQPSRAPPRLPWLLPGVCKVSWELGKPPDLLSSISYDAICECVYAHVQIEALFIYKYDSTHLPRRLICSLFNIPMKLPNSEMPGDQISWVQHFGRFKFSKPNSKLSPRHVSSEQLLYTST